MPAKDLHDKPFDEATLAKLDIFEKYTQAWLPVFVMQKAFSVISIFDLFAGTGYDINGVQGSPIRILSVIKRFIPLIVEKNVIVKLFFNEYMAKKNRLLKSAVEQYLSDNSDVDRVIRWGIFQDDFNNIYRNLLPEIQANPSLVFLDQNGVKFSNIENLLALERTKQTDFLFFISSSYVRRFGGSKEFSSYLNIDIEELKNNPYRFIHQDVVRAIAKQLPVNTELKLYPFSIRKGNNIHGLVFGAKHPRAVEKFLNVVWDKYPINGEANFDINEEATNHIVQYDLFAPPPERKKTKVEKFLELLEQTLKQQQEVTNKYIYLFTLGQGHTIKQANDHIKELKKNGKVLFPTRAPKLSFKEIYKENEVVLIKWIGR